jgi:glycosyltransferase involved in cell wall biosynthesis
MVEMRGFLLITPAKDEDKFLPLVIESLLKTDKLPVLWLIVDDGSTDDTLKIIREASTVHSFIKFVSVSQTGGRDLTYRYSRVCRLGFERAITLAESSGLDWGYIALLDADIVLSRGYFEALIADMEGDSSIGIESGEIFSYMDERVKRVRVFDETPRGGARVWSKECFTRTGGYVVSQSPDSVATAKANIMGWKTKKNSGVIAYELRETSSAEGLWKGYMNVGRSLYYLHYNPVLVIFNALAIAVRGNPSLIVPYLSGYVASIFGEYPKIDDESVKQYFWYTRFIHRVKNLVGIRSVLG